MLAEGSRKVVLSYCQTQQNKEQSSVESSISCLALRCFCTFSCHFNACNNRIQTVYKESNLVCIKLQYLFWVWAKLGGRVINAHKSPLTLSGTPVILHNSHDCTTLFSSKLHGTVIEPILFSFCEEEKSWHASSVDEKPPEQSGLPPSAWNLRAVCAYSCMFKIVYFLLSV